MVERLVVDASAMVEILIATAKAAAVDLRVRGCELHAPAHFDAQVISALGRLHRDGQLSEDQVTDRLDLLAAAPVERHVLPILLRGAWNRRHDLRLVDALYVELAEQLPTALVTTDAGMADASSSAEELGA